MPVLRICLWSGPRNVSTALMYAFAQRSDTRVIDEPIYAHYLRVSGADHPMRDEVLAAYDSDGERVVREVVLGPCDRPVLFMKQMAHHLVELDRGFLAETTNVFLVRDPEQMLPSLSKQIPVPRMRDTGYALQTELLDQLIALGQDPPVLESRELLLDPTAVLTRLCERLRISPEIGMLSWKAAARPEDGLWAPAWYRALHSSTGFRPYTHKTGRFPDRLRPLLEECRPHYERLRALAIRAGS